MAMAAIFLLNSETSACACRASPVELHKRPARRRPNPLSFALQPFEACNAGPSRPATSVHRPSVHRPSVQQPASARGLAQRSQPGNHASLQHWRAICHGHVRWLRGHGASLTHLNVVASQHHFTSALESQMGRVIRRALLRLAGQQHPP